MESEITPRIFYIIPLTIVIYIFFFANVYGGDLEQTYQQMLAERSPTSGLRAFLLQHPEFINTANSQGETALHIAAERGDTSFAEFLISNEADLNVSVLNKRNYTPIAFAIRSCKRDMVKLLLKRGAEPDGLLFFAWGNSCSPMEALSGFRSSRRRNFFQSISEQHDTVSRKMFVDLLLKYGANPNETNDMGNTLLHEFVEQGNVKQIQSFIHHHARIDIRNNNGVTSQDIALIMIGVGSLMHENFLSEFEKLVAGNESQRVVYPTMIRKFRDFLADFGPQKKSIMAAFNMRMLMNKHGITGSELFEYGKYRLEYAGKNKTKAHPEIENRLKVYKALMLAEPADEDSPERIFIVFVIVMLTSIISTGIVLLMRRLS